MFGIQEGPDSFTNCVSSVTFIPHLKTMLRIVSIISQVENAVDCYDANLI